MIEARGSIYDIDDPPNTVKRVALHKMDGTFVVNVSVAVPADGRMPQVISWEGALRLFIRNDAGKYCEATYSVGHTKGKVSVLPKSRRWRRLMDMLRDFGRPDGRPWIGGR